MKATTKTLNAAHKKALEISEDKSLIVKQPDRITIWIGEDDEVWDEMSETYTPSKARTIADRLLELFDLHLTWNGSKYDLTVHDTWYGDFNDPSAAMHY